MFRFIIISLTLIVLGCAETTITPSGRDTSNDPEGIWLGTQTSIGVGAFDMKSIIYDGRIYGISEDAGVMYAGTYIMNQNYLISDGRDNSETTYKLYDIYNNNNAFSIGLVGAHIESKNYFQGSFQNDAGQEGELYSYYSRLFENPASIDYIKGGWLNDRLNVSISPSGILTGSIDDCKVEGEITVPNDRRNIYEVSFATYDCETNGDYDGLGMIMEDDTGTPYFMALASNSSRMETIGFALDSSPISSIVSETVENTSRQAEAVITSEHISKPEEQTARYTGTHDGEDFSSEALKHNITNSSYQNSTFNHTHFAGLNFLDKYLTYTISNSNFSGSTFREATFGQSVSTGANSYTGSYTTTLYLTNIVDSNFSNTTFTGHNYTYSKQELYINPENTNFSGSTFENYSIVKPGTGNNYTNAEFINSYMTVDSDSSNTFSNTQFTESRLNIKSNIDVGGFTLSDSELNIYADDLDYENADFGSGNTINLLARADLSGATIGDNTFRFNKNSTYANILDFKAYTGGVFKETDFTDSTIIAYPSFEDSTLGAYEYYPIDVKGVNFSKANFTNAKFKSIELNSSAYAPDFLSCDFTAANFKDADIGDAVFDLSKFNYANLQGAQMPSVTNRLTSYFGNAWWSDGSRCSAISVGACLESPIDTGLTYEEYMNGKDDLDKAAESIKTETKKLVDTGTNFIKNTSSPVTKYVFGW